MSSVENTTEKMPDLVESGARGIFNGLTGKQRRFVEAYAQTANGVASARLAYGVEDVNTAGIMAFENLNKPKIRQALQKILGNLASPEYVISKFFALSTSARSEDTQLRATDSLAKVHGLFTEKHIERTIETIKITLPPSKIIDAKFKDKTK